MSDKKSERKQQLKEQLLTTVRRLEVPVAVAAQTMAGLLDEADIAGHPSRRQWQAQYQDEVRVQESLSGKSKKKQKSFRRRQARQISDALKISQDKAYAILNGTLTPSAAVAQDQVQREQREQRRLEEEQWLADAATALRKLGLSLQMVEAILPRRRPGSPGELSAAKFAARLWSKRLQQSGFDEPGELIDAWQQHHVWTAEELHWAQQWVRKYPQQPVPELAVAGQAAIWHFRSERAQAQPSWRDLSSDEQLSVVRKFLDWKAEVEQQLPRVSLDLLVQACAFGLRPQWRQGKRGEQRYDYLVFCNGDSRRVKWHIAPFQSKRARTLTGLALYHHNYLYRPDGFHAQRRYARNPQKSANDLVQYIVDHELYERGRTG